ncbi:hypothetical protein GCM10010145_64550 [Streptomyces ruber]|uniref:N-acetyltransferase domain-containing protein n=2 Tax=Streptomyces TaxID=1883 RepID=A0A918BRH2_9ACTN|nr:hypothetical protein GCM10010145_64550 [Streptomyces ruber]
MAAGAPAVWAARGDAGRPVGAVNLAFPDRAPTAATAGLAEPMVHRDTRGRGLGSAVPAAAEGAAAAAGSTLLHLDTETGGPAESLYRSAGWTRVGATPDYAADRPGVLRSTTLHFEQVPVRAVTREV